MKRRTFIGLARLGAAFWLPSIVKASQEPIATDGTAAVNSTKQHLPQDECTFQFGNGCQTVIKVIGVGGAGGKAIRHMIGKGVHGVDFVVADTDAWALEWSNAKTLIQLDPNARVTKTRPEACEKAAMDSRQRITECLKGAHMVIIVAGLGGGTGTRATPVIAEIARDMGILTVGLVTVPFTFEGRHRKIATTKIATLQTQFDSLILIDNDSLLDVRGDPRSMNELFESMNNIVREIVSGMTAMITIQGLVGVDFEDVRTVMENMGLGMIGVATATGADRARIAAQNAITSPLLKDIDLAVAQGLLVSISASRGLKMKEINEVMNTVRESVAEDAHIIFGTSYDESLGRNIQVSIIATGYAYREEFRSRGELVQFNAREKSASRIERQNRAVSTPLSAL